MQIIFSLVLTVTTLLNCQSLECSNTSSSVATDSLKKHGVVTASSVYRVYYLAVGLFHALLVILPQGKQEAVCPNSEHVRHDHIFPTYRTATALTLICLGSCIRIYAFWQLGPCFTFSLSKPDRLVTTGIYRYVRHPAYAGLAIQAPAVLYFWAREDGVLACLMSDLPLLHVVTIVHWCFWAVALPMMGWVRIKEEEELLEKTFGQQWKEYRHTTRMLVPFLF
ncbi:hypothetical protein BO83DRAFT_418553 [Aspergillus eucalypticola CBS 122712]|uniref:Protein-S-isoprenylcysteine O-methyltransferase n=1 Tax=Aspergillus eucalypticola (strain CBS 122712 / IBT 29274) TaxID=1448314 RepID=A0A317V8L8_ASPEC|nr:uncharacterized protein BO83DRAFT_418553 [Aspergillus eucalypticola CBS 122712]PWY69378.1 hypothetical protein BO83DRAFT_418553 [Aspergillus eucalypticola CBS 122712]